MTPDDLKHIGALMAQLWPYKWGRTVTQERADSIQRVVQRYRCDQVVSVLRGWSDTETNAPEPAEIGKRLKEQYDTRQHRSFTGPDESAIAAAWAEWDALDEMARDRWMNGLTRDCGMAFGIEMARRDASAWGRAASMFVEMRAGATDPQGSTLRPPSGRPVSREKIAELRRMIQAVGRDARRDDHE